MKTPLVVALAATVSTCATLTEDAMTPVALSFSDGNEGNCNLSNKRGAWTAPVPSRMRGTIIASAVFIDLGIANAITDKHRRYPPGFVIPLPKLGGTAAPAPTEVKEAPSVPAG